jgi:hypothetical protein
LLTIAFRGLNGGANAAAALSFCTLGFGVTVCAMDVFALIG